MTEYTGKTFQNEDIRLDGGAFKDCAFFDCTLRFDDEEDCEMENCTALRCQFVFGSQEAHDAFMKAIAADPGSVFKPREEKPDDRA